MKLYLVTRSDLSPGQQAVQAAHALREFADKYPEEDRQWYEKSNYLVLLSVPEQGALEGLLGEAEDKGIPAAPFREPDMGEALTAVAIGPSGKKICRKLQLALI
jgi:peptidyl-tRNA hydrolase